jgi:hypothetical protein
MASIILAAFESPAGAQLVTERSGMRGGCGWDRRLDRISIGIYENAVRLHRREHEQLARRVAVLHLQEKLADLKAGIQAIKAHVLPLEFAYPSAQ